MGLQVVPIRNPFLFSSLAKGSAWSRSEAPAHARALLEHFFFFFSGFGLVRFRVEGSGFMACRVQSWGSNFKG